MGRGAILRGIVLSALVSSCGDDTAPIAPLDTEVTIEIVSGDDQMAVPQDTLSTPFVVVVRDGDNQPVSGSMVEFTFVEGEGEFVSQSDTTDDSGRASTAIVPSKATCISDTSLAVVQVQARVEGTDQSVKFTARMHSEEFPHVLSKVDPLYPEIARKAGVEADVDVTIVVDSTGAVAEIREITGPEVFHGVVRDAVQHWSFEPASQDCIPVTVLVRVPFRFKLGGGDSAGKLLASPRLVWRGSFFEIEPPIYLLAPRWRRTFSTVWTPR